MSADDPGQLQPLISAGPHVLRGIALTASALVVALHAYCARILAALPCIASLCRAERGCILNMFTALNIITVLVAIGVIVAEVLVIANVKTLTRECLHLGLQHLSHQLQQRLSGCSAKLARERCMPPCSATNWCYMRSVHVKRHHSRHCLMVMLARTSTNRSP